MQADKSRSIKGLLLDLDNTLYLYEPAHQAGIAAVFRIIEAHHAIAEEKLNKSYEAAKQAVKLRLHATAASHHRLLYLQGMLESLGIFSLELTELLYETYWENFFANIKPIAGTQEVLPSLAKKYKIGIITNFIALTQFTKIKKLALTPYIHYLITSEEIGCEKPDLRIFQAACKKMQLQPEEICMIGDDLAADIIPAKQLGMETYWLTTTPEPRNNDHSLFKTCSTFYELQERLL